MYNYELVTLLEKVLYKSYQMKNGEHAFHCPFCNHHKKKLQVNIETQKWHCWVCNTGGHKIGILLRKINTPKQIISEVLKILGDYKGVSKEKDEKTEYDVSLPQCYKPLWKKSDDPLYKNAIHYLKQRGITEIDILRYSIGYCTSNGYSNRIIIPSYDADGKLNYFMARDMFPNSKFKYKNPPMSKDTVGFELFINWNEPIVLCEGIFDAIAIRNNAIPLFGKFPSKTLVKRLVEKKVEKIYIALDEDARKDAIKLSKFLMDYGIETYLLNMKDKDPSELGFTKFWEILKETKQSKFSDIIKGRLYGKGWILVKDKFWESYETDRLVKEFHNQNINVQLVDPTTIDIFVNKDNKKSILVNGLESDLPKFVFPRTGSGTTYHIKAVIRHFERMGVPVINSSEAIDNVKDKLYTHQILAQSNLDIPKTMLLKHPIDIDFVEKNIGFPAIVKRISGSYGRGVFLAETKKQLKQLLTMAELTKKSYNIIIQEFIKDTWGKDLRVLVVNNKVVGCMMRQSQDDDFRANITRGGEGFPYEVNEQIEWLSTESAKALELDIAGVDLLFDNGGFKICEVNSNPGFEGMEQYTKKNIAEEIVQFIKMKIGAYDE